MICANCEKHGKRLEETMTFKERVHMLTAAATMRKHLDANVNVPSEDKEISSSIITKLMLSFQPHAREQLLQMLRQSAGVQLTLRSCPHGLVAL